MKHILTMAATVVLAASCFGQTDSREGIATDSNVIAVVLGKKITATQKDNLNKLIFASLLRQFAKENKIEPTEEELDAFVLKIEEKERRHQIKMEVDRRDLIEELKNASLSEREREQKASHLKTIESILKRTRETKRETEGMEKQMRPVKRQMARQFVKSWKINKALYDKYGGRVIFQQAGAEPLDAYRDFLKEQEKKGAFQIIDKRYETDFWRYFRNDAMHTFYDKEEGAKFINTPWWMMDEPPE